MTFERDGQTGCVSNAHDLAAQKQRKQLVRRAELKKIKFHGHIRAECIRATGYRDRAVGWIYLTCAKSMRYEY